MSDQVKVGGSFLRDRVVRCGREKGIPGGIVAVDFYERTGVVAVAKQLNDGPR